MYLLSSGPNTYNENETIAKYEIMDGAPVRGILSLSLSLVLHACFPLMYLWIIQISIINED